MHIHDIWNVHIMNVKNNCVSPSVEIVMTVGLHRIWSPLIVFGGMVEILVDWNEQGSSRPIEPSWNERTISSTFVTILITVTGSVITMFSYA